MNSDRSCILEQWWPAQFSANDGPLTGAHDPMSRVHANDSSDGRSEVMERFRGRLAEVIVTQFFQH